jgi:putative ABC transport system permease protein
MRRIRQAVRSLLRSRWYAAAMIAVLGLGIGLITAVFAVVDGVLFKPLPYPDVDTLFGVSARVSTRDGAQARVASVSEAHLDAWREALPEAQFTGYNASGFDVSLAGELVEIAQVDEYFLDVIGLAPHLGGFRQADFTSPSATVWPALMTFDLWRQRFGGDPAIVGRAFPDEVRPDEPPRTIQIVGVLHPDFIFPESAGVLNPQLLVPKRGEVETAAAALSLAWRPLVRISGQIPLSELDARLSEATRRVAQRYPPPRPERTPTTYDAASLLPIRVALTTATRTNFAIFMGAGASLLLLGCVNVAGLTAARLLDRQREFMTRRALGARTGDLAVLLVTETVLLVLPAAVLGLALGSVLTDLVRQLIPGYKLFKPLAMDLRVGMFVLLASLLCVSVVTAAALRATRFSAGRSAAGPGGTFRQPLSQRLLVAGQVAIAFVLVMAGSLFIASVIRAWQEEPGFATEGGFRIELEGTRRGAPQHVAEINDLVRRIRSIPGVIGAGGLEHSFLQQIFNGSTFDDPAGADTRGIESFDVTAGFFTATGLTAVEGRLPTDAEFETGAPVLAVSRRAATRYWPDRPAVGQTLTRDGRAFAVVGVVGDIRYRSLDVEPGGEVYCSIAVDPRPFLWNVYVRFAPGTERSLSSVLAAIARSQSYRVAHVRSAKQSYAEGIRNRRFSAWVFGAFAVSALVIAGSGILGLLTMTTARRTRELGIRSALGASPAGLLGMLLAEQLKPVAGGLSAGVVAAYWVVELVQGSLYGFEAYRSEVWLGTIAIILLIGLAGAAAPALRASGVNPMDALRAD